MRLIQSSIHPAGVRSPREKTDDDWNRMHGERTRVRSLAGVGEEKDTSCAALKQAPGTGSGWKVGGPSPGLSMTTENGLQLFPWANTNRLFTVAESKLFKSWRAW